ncbi:conserved exported hypothetical protein [Candidatus Sulfopaludibacter sp. SbA4]|nr:conserved exported hypothetical protein [Candidatus Sulfopaludibacter sp. SbA4]
MTKKLLFVTTILLVVAFAAFAADVSGKWVYDQPGRGGGDPVKVTVTLKNSGGSLTGDVSRPGRDGNAMSTPISEGKVDGNDVSFKVTTQMGGNSMTTDYKGTVSGDELKLKVTRPGRNGGDPVTTEFSAKRATT